MIKSSIALRRYSMSRHATLKLALCGFCLLTAVGMSVAMWKPAPIETLKPAVADVPWVTSEINDGLRLDDARPVGELRSLAADKNRSSQARAQAMYHLAKLNDWGSVEVLLAQLTDKSALVRGRAAASLRHILGTDFYYRANDAEQKRVASIKDIRRYWDSRKANPPVVE